MRRLRDSSKVHALRLIWRLFTQPKSLWVSWIKHYLHRYNSFWDVTDDSKGSWSWRKLLKLQSIAYEFMKMQVRNGEDTHFWFDNWMGVGKLIDITGAIGTTYIGLPFNAVVCDATNNNGWSMRNKRSRRFQALYTQIVSEPVPDGSLGRDIVLWKLGVDQFQDSFSAANTWEQIRAKRPKVNWCNIVWFSQGISRYAFITWLAVYNRLSAGDRMRVWGVSQACVLCGQPDEMRDHLFFCLSLLFHGVGRSGEGFLWAERKP